MKTKGEIFVFFLEQSPCCSCCSGDAEYDDIVIDAIQAAWPTMNEENRTLIRGKFSNLQAERFDEWLREQGETISTKVKP